LGDFNFACDAPAKVLDINTEIMTGLSDHFIPYSRDINKKLVFSTFAGDKMDRIKGIQKTSLYILIKYPDTVRCVRYEDLCCRISRGCPTDLPLRDLGQGSLVS